MHSTESPAHLTIRQRVAATRRIVIKVGTNVLIRKDGSAAIGLVYSLVESAVNARNEGRQVLIVSSGAIGLGAKRLGLKGSPSELALKQACAAVGQSRLMALYEHAFRNLDTVAAQVLLTEDDFLDPVRYSNLRNTLGKLLELGVVPIINENDTVSTLELNRPENGDGTHHIFGDNDKLSALVMTKIDADLLILLSDVDGLYTGDPEKEGSRFIPEVSSITDQIAGYASGAKARGRGGMKTKIEAARLATDAGKLAIIANGRTPHIIERICAGEELGTVFLPQEKVEWTH
jgi:glutamate 5-kinase